MYSYNAGQRNKSVTSTSNSSNNNSSETSSNLSSIVEIEQQNRPFSYETETAVRPTMVQSEWNNRLDRHKESTVFPVFTPAPRQPHQSMGGLNNNGNNTRQQHLQHQVTFSESPNYKMIYLVALIIVTLLLISLIVLIIILFATKRVFFYDPAQPLNNNIKSTTITNNRLPSQMPPEQQQQQTFPQPNQIPNFITKTFKCELFILNQANNAYNNKESFEYYQAKTILSNALANTFDGSSLRDMNPTINLEKLENSESDLQIIFSISIIVLEQNKSIGEMTIKNLLLSQLGVLEGLINQTNIDRNRVFVSEI
ncbi:hypothetical protein Mgra_00004534 [Meloidogyne graminicola]|uniref:SEA domain-containing protein n=1 Tax=Meloidogyne graminicola TaxID=189291 RepID=A0A8S9ZRQ3_9BILA|nr:hypothetical protein Mgra_00004534 [Meloidogyne graminicola]